MSDGNKFDVTAYAQQRQHNRIPLEEMGNALLDAMQGTLICLDKHHFIIDVSKTIKRYFGFEQTEIIGSSILLFIEDSERDSFLKFLSNSSQSTDTCFIRMLIATTNQYQQVKVHRKKKFNQDNIDVHSTTPRYTNSVRTILVLTLDEGSFIDIKLSNAHKQEFYIKMNLLGELIFQDHRGALITGYLPYEIISKSIFKFVYHEDNLIQLHALWKCVTTGTSKLQWRLNARDGSLVFLQTEYKLVANHLNQDTIVARNEVLDPAKRFQFEELQTARRHQCAADMKGYNSSFKLITPNDFDLSSISNGKCRIYVPTLSICFSTYKLNPLNIIGNIFDDSKSSRPLTIEDYISILFDNEKYLDSELISIINNISSISAYYKRSVNNTNQLTNDTSISDITMNEKLSMKSSSSSNDSNQYRKYDPNSIVRGILNNSIKYNNEKPNDDSSILMSKRTSNGNALPNDLTRISTRQQPYPIHHLKSNQIPSTPEAIQQQHFDFMKKYKAAKAKLESQLEIAQVQTTVNGAQASDLTKRNNILSKLSQLENIKNKHVARTLEHKRQTHQSSSATAIVVNKIEQKDLLNGLFNSSPSNNSNSTTIPLTTSTSFNPSPLYSTNYQHQQNSSPVYRTATNQFDCEQSQTYFHEARSRVKTPVLDDFLTPPPSTSSSSIPMNNPSISVYSYMNVTFQNQTDNSTSSSFNNNHQQQNSNYPY